jgi:heat shock protein HslJ
MEPQQAERRLKSEEREGKGNRIMSYKNALLAALALVVLVSVVACSGMAPGSEDPLDGTSWVLMGYGFAAVLPGTEITAKFEDGEVSGSSGCNTYGGSYEVKGETISFKDIFMTEMACLDPEGVMQQEQTYLEYLSGAQTFQVSPGQLQFTRADGETLTFIPAE